jgi:hypothetical protein
MKIFCNKYFFLGVIAFSFMLSSCSTVDNLAVKWKYRNDFKLAKASPDNEVNAKEQAKNVFIQIADKDEQSNIAGNAITDEVKTKSVAKKICKEETKRNSSTLNSKAQESRETISPKATKKIERLEKAKKATGNGSIWGALSLVFGLLGFLTFWLGITGVLFGLLAIIFGIIGLTGNKDGKGMAIAGIIFGALGLILGGAWLAFVLAAASSL